METVQTQKVFWWFSADLRISHPALNPIEISTLLDAVASIAMRPGESKVHHGDCRSAGYWVTVYRSEAPTRPDSGILWSERFVGERKALISDLLEKGYSIDVYIGIHSNVLALGFNIPPTPILWELGITLGIDYFSP